MLRPWWSSFRSELDAAERPRRLVLTGTASMALRFGSAFDSYLSDLASAAVKHWNVSPLKVKLKFQSLLGIDSQDD